MRQKQQIQPRLSSPWPTHRLARELAVMASIVQANPVIAEFSWQDLTKKVNSSVGHLGMDVMSVVKAAV